jgi:hypothetical protein
MRTSRAASPTTRRAHWLHVSIAALTLATILAGAAAHTGCSSRDCAADLASYCADHSCPTYEESIASRCFGCDVGLSYGTFSCGGYRIITCTNVDVTSLQYYAENGKLVAVALGGSEAKTSCEYGPSSYFDLPCGQSFGAVAAGGSVFCELESPTDAGGSALDGGAD